MRWSTETKEPVWEGVVIPGLSREDPRTTQWIVMPCSRLAPVVSMFWFVEWRFDGLEYPALIVPAPISGYAVARTLGNAATEDRAAISLPRARGQLITLSGHQQMVGIQFTPGGLFALCGQTMNKRPSFMTDVESLLPGLPDVSRSDWDQKFLETWLERSESRLMAMLDAAGPHHADVINEVICAFGESDEHRPIGEIAAAAGIPLRSLQRLFSHEVGLSPRDAQRVVRFQRAIQRINRGDWGSLAVLALESGFFDQAHMVNEFRKLVDSLPREFSKFW